MYDIIIVGAGPSGLTAGIYASRSNLNVLILEKTTYGGQIINASDVENYPTEEHVTGVDFATKLYNQAKNLGSVIKFQEVLKINNYDNYKEVITNKETYKTKAVIIATGCKNRKLNIDNEDKLIGKGISYCATCDGNFYKEKKVAVVGGGNTAIDDALYLSDICEKVYLIHRREEFRVTDKSLNLLKNKENVEFILNSNVTKLNGEYNLESIEIIDKDNNKKILDISCLFIAIGQIPENKIFTDLINIDNNGFVIADEDCTTNVDGIFVSGDIREKEVRQLVTATSDGAVAALQAIKYINN